MTMGKVKANNDPWVPLPDDAATTNESFPAAPSNPLYDVIDSKRYIESLERKLANLTRQKRGGPTSRDIITSLATFHEDQMRRFIDSDQSEEPVTEGGRCSPSFVQRKLHPAQPVSEGEMLALVADDVLARSEVTDDVLARSEVRDDVLARSKVTDDVLDREEESVRRRLSGAETDASGVEMEVLPQTVQVCVEDGSRSGQVFNSLDEGDSFWPEEALSDTESWAKFE